MRCHACDVAVGDGQRFCHECGAALAGVTDPTEQIETLPASAGLAAPKPGDRVALDLPLSISLPDDALPPTEPVDEVPAATSAPTNSLDSVPWQTDESPVVPREPTATMPASVAPIGFDPADPYPPIGDATTDELAATHSSGLFDGAEEVSAEAHHEAEGFTLRASFVFAVLAMISTLMVSIADVIDVRTSVPIDGIAPGIRYFDDVGTNLAIGGFIGSALMLLGGLAACFGWRWGAGLAGGSGLAVAGWAALTIGLFERPLFDARTTFSSVEGLPQGAVLTTTRGLGWFLLLAIGVLGIIVFLTSLRQAGTGGRPGLNPWIAAVGGLGAVVFAAGPLIPLGTADLAANLGFATEPRAFFAGRLVQLGLLAATGVVGFLSVRTYGLGLAAGGMSVAIWMWATTLADLGSGPVGPALGNLGSRDTTPHAVTSVGVAVAVLMMAIAVTIAAVGRPRQT